VRRGWVLLGVAVVLAGAAWWAFGAAAEPVRVSDLSRIREPGPSGRGAVTRVAVFRDGGEVPWGALAIASGLMVILLATFLPAAPAAAPASNSPS
jgi:hypothetical protein